MRRSLVIALGLLTLLAGGCLLDDLEPRGRPCNANVGCGPGTVCDMSQGICVVVTDGGPADAGVAEQSPDQDRPVVSDTGSDAPGESPAGDGAS